MQTEAVFADRLSQSTVRKHFHPILDVDWDVEIDLDRFYVTEPLISIYGTETYESLSPTEKRLLSLYESVSNLSTGIWLENSLMYGFLDRLYDKPYDEPDYRYMLHETADEANHSIMFHQYVRKIGLGYSPVTPTARRLGQFFRRHIPRIDPYLFMMGVLSGEEPPDYFGRALCRDESAHPLIHRISEIHSIEEGRHIAYAREFLSKRFPNGSKFRRANSKLFAPVNVKVVVWQFFFPRWPTGTDAAPEHLRFSPETRQKIDRARRENRPRRYLLVQDSVKRLVSFFEEIGVITRRTRPLWRKMGLIGG